MFVIVTLSLLFKYYVWYLATSNTRLFLRVVAVQQLEVYWSLLRAVRGSTLKLTKMDDAIYAHFIAEFPDYDVSKPLDENEMKSPKGKERWRNFINHYEKLIPDYAFGTILRISPHEEYGQYSTIFGTFPLLRSHYVF